MLIRSCRQSTKALLHRRFQMIPFKYQNGSSIKTGKINIISSSFPIEADIEANGWNFHVIVGKHKSGYYICIPNWNIGSELAGLADTFWNNERLSGCTKLGKRNSNIVATALAELNKVI